MKLINNRLYRLWAKLNGIKFGKGLGIFGWPIIYRFPLAEIDFGQNVNINSSLLSNLVGLYQPSIIIAKGTGKIRIGNAVGMSGCTIYSWKKITVGDRTIIGANAKIVDTDFHSVNCNRRSNSKYVKSAEIEIGKDVFIGMNSIILKGTKLRDGCVVGAGAVVSGDFPEYSLVVGNPAKVVGTVEHD